jgi:hypothetical protein
MVRRIFLLYLFSPFLVRFSFLAVTPESVLQFSDIQIHPESQVAQSVEGLC